MKGLQLRVSPYKDCPFVDIEELPGRQGCVGERWPIGSQAIHLSAIIVTENKNKWLAWIIA